MTDCSITIPAIGGDFEVRFRSGSSTVFLGANGGGKTRLGVFIETDIVGAPTHRVSAQRALHIKPRLDLVDKESAEEKLFFGLSRRDHPSFTPDRIARQRTNSRWGGRPETHLLDDYDALLQALFADERDSAIEYRQRARDGSREEVPVTKLDRLSAIWGQLLPHRRLIIADGSIIVRPTEVAAGQVETEAEDGSAEDYIATDLSDGERVILYLAGQALLVPTNCLLIIDEPELHIHKALMTQLWDSVEAARPDCAFVYITHDLEFAASRIGAQKFALQNYFAKPPRWDILPLPDPTSALPEEVVCRIVGSRRPVLFVEGDTASQDAALYRRVYPDHTIIPVGGCEAVIGSVASFRTNSQLHRLRCYGLVDRDDRSSAQVQHLATLDVFTTPVSEIENLFLLPDVFAALARTLGHEPSASAHLADDLSHRICTMAGADVEAFSLRYVKRQLDRKLKGLELAGASAEELARNLSAALAALNPEALATDAANRLARSAGAGDVETVLSMYDNKGLLAEAASKLAMNKRGFQEHIGRMLKAEIGGDFLRTVKVRLPRLTA